VPLLTRVSGLSTTLAANIVAHRDRHGAFANRQALPAEVPRLGEKTFELAAGFLRINDSDNPLDARRYTRKPTRSSSASSPTSKRASATASATAACSRRCSREIHRREVRPADRPRHPQGTRKARPRPAPGVQDRRFQGRRRDVKDLQPGMILEGVVTNVANFGAFVDIGVHQDGLVHISAIANSFVKDPRSVVKAGDVVKVKVLEVDLPRQRIALSMRLADDLPGSAKGGAGSASAPAPVTARARQRQQNQTEPGSAMASAFARLKR
jgi:uncharacterized protein